LDLLLPGEGIDEGRGQIAARAPEIHLEDQAVLGRAGLDHPLKRRIRDEEQGDPLEGRALRLYGLQHASLRAISVVAQ
jgi:hypothetical protein